MRLLRGFWALLVGIKDLLVLIFMLLFFGALYAALTISPTPRTAGSGALVIDLDGSLVEQPAPIDPFRSLAGSNPVGREYRLRDVVRAIDSAARDDSVKAVVLDLDSFTGGGQTAIEAAGRAVDRVRQAGKPVLAYATGYTDGGYLLAAHASEVWLDPQGAVLLTGRGGEQLYYKGLLDKLGVKVNVYRVGRFKSAVEPFTRTGQSDEARKANQALADSLWQNWLANVAQARPAAKLAAYVNAPVQAVTAAGGDTAKAASMAGLVDRIGDRIAFGKRVAEIAGADKRQSGAYRAIPLEGWLASHPEPHNGPLVGILTVAGTIVDGQAAAGTAGSETISRLLLGELAKNRIKALVVRIDSPGGSVTGSERIRSAILEAKAKGLPVIVSMGSVAASGGYWIATTGDILFAQPSTITGSIGVFGLIPTFQGTLAKLGLSADGVKTTPLSGEPDVYRGTSPTFDALIQTGIDSVYRRFTGLVATSRHLSVAQVDAIGQGRVWAGSEAQRIGLVDQFGGIDAAIAEAARRAKLDPAKVSPLYIEKEPGWAKKILATLSRDRRDDGEAAPRDAWTMLAQGPQRDIATALTDLQMMAGGPAIQVRCLECPVTGAPRTQAPAGWMALLLAKLGLS